MSYGMTYDEYWNGDNFLPRYYRKAYQIKREQADSEAWLQGRYIYDALLAASPVFNALSKKKEPLPYVKQPYLQDVVIPKEETKEEKERKQMQTQRQLFEAKVIEFNAKFLKRKEAEKNGGKL